MQRLTYYLLLPFLYGISLLPFPLLYLLSDFINLLLFRIIGYRKEVIKNNLSNSFPDRNADEIRDITKKFHRFFCDLMLETLKVLTISESTLRKRITFDPSIFEHYYKEGQSVIILLGHWGNWEWAVARFGIEDVHRMYGIYRRLKNPYFDKLLYRMRTRFGTSLYDKDVAVREMAVNRKKLTATALIADQSPSSGIDAFWTDFMNQDAAFFYGPEFLSRSFNYPVIYTSFDRIKRGYYRIHTEVLVEDPSKTDKDEIILSYIRRLEQDMRAKPEIWLWTHRKWKHTRPAE